MFDIKSCTILSNGVKMPWLGFGTYKVGNGEVTAAVAEALNAGYKHIDTASLYDNEDGVSTAIKNSELHRDEIFLVSKVWNTDQGYDKTLEAFKTSLKKLRTDYLDLYLVHWPNPLQKDTWKALEKLYKDGYVRAIGVSNFTFPYLNNLIENCEIMPMVNQMEFHPYLIQNELREFCMKHNIQYEAWSPLMRGKVFEIDLLKELAEKYNKTVSQIVLRWDLQMKVVSIPKSTTPSRIKENADIFDFELSEEDVNKISSLDKGLRVGSNPDTVYNSFIS